MKYEEKYKNGLECIQEILSGGADLIRISTLRKRLQPFFPELKENEDKDERIRKEIIDFIKSKGGFKGGWLTWIEKYGKQNPVEWSEEDEKIKESIKKVLADTDFNKLDIKYSFCEMITWLEKQKKKKHFSDFNADDWYVSEVDGKIHNAKFIENKDGKKPADKIEPKFHEDDWIIFNGLILHIDEVVNGYYRTTSIGDGIHNSYDWDIDNAARLWTIADAKVGTVLVDEDNNIGIYVGKNDDFWHSCIYLGCDGCLHGINIGAYHKHNNTKLGTKEQRDLLFQKMKEAGYEWDPDKKEVKRIESEFDGDDILLSLSLGNNQVQDILEDMGMLDENGRCPHTAEEIFKAGMEHAFNLNREAASSVKIK